MRLSHKNWKTTGRTHNYSSDSAIDYAAYEALVKLTGALRAVGVGVGVFFPSFFPFLACFFASRQDQHCAVSGVPTAQAAIRACAGRHGARGSR
jgi:hypothetical protein